MTRLDAEQIRQLHEIAAQLSQHRQQRGISLEEIAAKTYVQLRHLKAIENGQVELLPEPVFVQGFIRRYADAVGMDGYKLARSFNIQSSRREPAEPAISRRKASVPPPPRPLPEALQGEIPQALLESVQPALPRQEASPFKIKPAMILGGSILTIVLYFVGRWLFNIAFSPRPIVPAQSSPSPLVQRLPVQPPQASPAPIAPVELKVALLDEAWLMVKVDGKPVFEGTLTKGSGKIWQGQREVILQTGNAGAISFSLNGAKAKTAGEVGEVRTFTFRRESSSPAVESPALPSPQPLNPPAIAPVASPTPASALPATAEPAMPPSPEMALPASPTVPPSP